MKNKNDEVFLTENQLKGLEKLATITFDEEGKPCENLSWIGKFFVWLDTNILSKTTKFWLYILEIVGVAIIFIIVGKTTIGLNLIINAKTELDLAKAKMYIDSLTALSPAIAGMVGTICGALPIAIGTMRSLGKKWMNGKDTVQESEVEVK